MLNNFKFMDYEIRLPIKIIILVSFVAILTTTDLIVKDWVSRNLQNQKQVTVIKNFWYNGYTENDDIGLSALRGITGSLSKQHKFFLTVGLQGLASIIVLIFYFSFKPVKYIIPLTFIICGGLGNLIDRIIRGYVVDYIIWFFKFIPLRFFNPFPVFNLADVYTSIGAFFLLIAIIFFSNNEKEKTSTL